MGISLLENQFTINGVLSTDDSVLSNMEKIAASCGCWITYDIHDGKWSVIINQAGTSTHSFDDSNIIGSVNVNGTGLTDLYNSVKVTYTRYDINDEIDWVQVDLPAADRNFNEPDQVLEMELFMTNDPVQAELVGFLELKQNRVDKIITFQTDYTGIDLNAGDLVDITNSTMGWTAKVFRIINMREIDSDDGSIRIEITALEYDSTVYDNDLNRYSRSSNDGILSIGSIGTPSTPTISVYEQDARPRAVLTGTTPSGLVNGVEFWLSQSSSTTGFELVGVSRPQTSTSYSTGTSVSVDIDNVNAGNIFVKTRGFNSDIDGPFSSVANIAYAPLQTANAVDPNTQVVDDNGNLLTLAALTSLLRSLDGMYSSGNIATGSLYDKIFNAFQAATGSDIRDGQIPGVGTAIGNAFATISVSGQSDVVATGEDYFTLVAGNNISITTDSFSDTITFDVSGVAGSGFSNVYANGTSLLASDSTTLTINAGSNVSITANASTETMTIDTNGYWQGAKKYVQSGTPSGASNGDIWFKI